jgi:hypothetical protein
MWNPFPNENRRETLKPMHSCRKSREIIIALLSGDLPEAKRQAVLQDVESCPRCGQEYRAGAQALRTLARAQDAMLPPESYWPEYETALRNRLLAMNQVTRHPGNRGGRWYLSLGVAAAAAAVLFAVRPREAVSRAPIDRFGSRVHIQRVDLLLRAMDRSGAPTDHQNQRRHARSILQDNTVLRLQAEALGDTRTAATLSQFEPLLLDVAHLPEHPDPEEWDALRKRIQRESTYIETSLERGDVEGAR